MVTDVLIFPMDRRVGKIRDVAGKMLAKSTDRHAAFYRDQISQALRGQLIRIGLSDQQCDQNLTAFWQAVQVEMIRNIYRGNLPGGTAA